MRPLATVLLALVAALSAEAAAAGPVLHWRPLNEPGCGGWITSVAVSPHEAGRVLVGGDMLGVGLSEDGGESWQSTFGFASWEIADFTWHPTDPKTVWVGTMSGPYVSNDGGRNWQARREGFPPIAAYQYSAPIQKVLFDPKDAKHLLAFGGSHRRWHSPGKPLWGTVWESRDGGAAWKKLSTVGGAEGQGANVLAVRFAGGSSDTLYAAADGVGFCISTDGGRTWEVRNSGLPMEVNINALAAHPTQKDTVWLALGAYRHPEEPEYTPGSVYKSTDAGRTWRASASGLGRRSTRDTNLTSRYEAIAVAPTSPDTLLTCDTSWGGATLYKSADGGGSWQPLLKGGGFEAAYPAGLCATVIEFSPRDAAVAFIAGSEYMLRTLDGGKTWTDVTARRAGAGWIGRGYSGLCSENVKWDPRDPKRAVLLGMDHGNFWQSRDGRASWTWGGEGMPNWGGSSDLTFAGDATMYVTLGQAGSFTGIGRTTDGGKRWTILSGAVCGLPNANARAQPLGIYAMPEDPKTVWAAIGGELCRSTDGGSEWKTVHPGPGLAWIVPVPGQPRHFFVSGAEGVYETTDGEKFALLPGSPKQAGRMTLDTSQPPRLYVTAWRASRGGLWRLGEGKWERLRDDHFIYDVAIDPTDPKRIAVATHDHPYHDVCSATGVWISSDGGTTWSQQNEGLPVLRGTTVRFNPHDPEELFFGSHGRGFFVTRWPKR